MTYDPYDRECSGDYETTTDQTYLCHIRMELQNVTAAINALTRVISERIPLAEPAPIEPLEDVEPDIDDEPLPDYGPPGSGAVITEWP